MRADSTRDFYAKTMAVLGLGALAGVGALVDGWPGTVDTPRVTPAAVFSVAADARPPLVVLAATPGPAHVPAPVSLVPHESRGSVREPVSLAAYESAPLLVAAVTLAAAEPAAPAAPEPMPVLDVRDPGPLRWSGVTELSLADVSAAPGPAHKVGGDSVITSAFKKTGSSLISAGKKTGEKAAGAARAVGGAFRKAFPL